MLVPCQTVPCRFSITVHPHQDSPVVSEAEVTEAVQFQESFCDFNNRHSTFACSSFLSRNTRLPPALPLVQRGIRETGCIFASLLTHVIFW